MAFNRPRRFRHRRFASFEQIEPRLMLSGQPAGDFFLDYLIDDRVSDHRYDEVGQTLTDAHTLTGMDQVLANYGFTGTGQTVAVIDSGIAYDHDALGSGLGSQYRVVGGYDFTENDADPYDDGPYGSHGTHVAGIIGSDAAGAPGVASSVDLVGLRVFDDDGAGYFSWVEQALQWVHDNRNAFENPITAVNLSLGASYNGSEPPYWAMLEEEFAQLEADGIFIAVAAGNDFTSYNTPGLGYPAASSYVVPVMSVDDNGAMSYFSQRHDRAIAAPGRSVLSSVPDYVGNNDGVANDYARYSGTSMATPYVAGASVIVRQAMEFAGMTGITQDSIYDLMRNTADTFYDSATSASYLRLNLQAAIDAIMPADDYGSTVAEACAAGSLGNGSSLSGSIGQLNDLDYFTFTASATGTMTLEASATHEMVASWQLEGATISQQSAEELVFDVVAGQSYTVGVGTTGGIGHYDIQVAVEGNVEWGVIAQETMNDNVVPISGQRYSFTAANDGIVTVEALFDHSAGDVDIQLYQGDQLVGGSYSEQDSERIDVMATAGDRFTVYAYSNGGYTQNDDVDFRVTNLVSQNGTAVNVLNAEARADLSFVMGSTHQLTVNGVAYQFDAQTVETVCIAGSVLDDTLEVTGTAGNEVATFRSGEFSFVSDSLELTANDVDNVFVNSGGGQDRAFMHGTSGYELFGARPEVATLYGSTFMFRATEFAEVTAIGNGGEDLAYFYDSAGDDQIDMGPTSAQMTGSGLMRQADGFASVYAYATNGGNDLVRLFGSSGNDTFLASEGMAKMYSPGFYGRALGFETAVGIAGTGGRDVAELNDGAGNDVLLMRPDMSRIFGDGINNYAVGFGYVEAFSTAGGIDTAHIHDSSGDDIFVVREGFARMFGDGFDARANGFKYVHGYSRWGGTDTAYMHDTTSDDLFTVSSSVAKLYGAGILSRACGFRYAHGFAANGGADRVDFIDSAGDDRLEITSNFSKMFFPDAFVRACDFEEITASSANGGNDEAFVSDTAMTDQLRAIAEAFHMDNEDFRVDLDGFGYVRAESTHGGGDTADVQSIDYILQMIGEWN